MPILESRRLQAIAEEAVQGGRFEDAMHYLTEVGGETWMVQSKPRRPCSACIINQHGLMYAGGRARLYRRVQGAAVNSSRQSDTALLAYGVSGK